MPGLHSLSLHCGLSPPTVHSTSQPGGLPSSTQPWAAASDAANTAARSEPTIIPVHRCGQTAAHESSREPR